MSLSPDKARPNNGEKLKHIDHTLPRKKIYLLLLIIFYAPLPGYFAWSEGKFFNNPFILCSRQLKKR
jgi:hypothetical protein